MRARISEPGIVTYSGAGLRAIDISNPFIPREVGYFIKRAG